MTKKGQVHVSQMLMSPLAPLSAAGGHPLAAGDYFVGMRHASAHVSPLKRTRAQLSELRRVIGVLLLGGGAFPGRGPRRGTDRVDKEWKARCAWVQVYCLPQAVHCGMQCTAAVQCKRCVGHESEACFPCMGAWVQVYCLPQGRRDVETVFTMGIMEDVNLVPQPAAGQGPPRPPISAPPRPRVRC